MTEMTPWSEEFEELVQAARDAGHGEMDTFLLAGGVPAGATVPNPHRGDRLGGWQEDDGTAG